VRVSFVTARHKNRTRRNSRCGPWLEDLPKCWGLPFNISATAEVSDFKFGIQLGFTKAHHKITPMGKSGRGLGLVNFYANFVVYWVQI